MTSLADMSVVILCGGLGTRLRDCVADRPKALAEVAGRPFLGYLLDHLIDCGVARAVLCTGYLGEQIEAEFSTRYRSLEIRYSHETEPLGTGGALVRAMQIVDTDRVLARAKAVCDLKLRVEKAR